MINPRTYHAQFRDAILNISQPPILGGIGTPKVKNSLLWKMAIEIVILWFTRVISMISIVYVNVYQSLPIKNDEFSSLCKRLPEGTHIHTQHTKQYYAHMKCEHRQWFTHPKSSN
jgi:hypothetical protein